MVFLGIVFKSEMCCSFLNKGFGEIFPRVICITEPQNRWEKKLAFCFAKDPSHGCKEEGKIKLQNIS